MKDPKRVIWLTVLGTAGLTVWNAVRNQYDPIPRLAGIGATGLFLLVGAEVAPKLAGAFAVLFGIAYALNYQEMKPIPAPNPVLGGGGGFTPAPPGGTGGGGGGGGAW